MSISKSQFLEGIKCKKSLWFSKYKKEFFKQDERKQYRFKIGN